MPSKKPKGTPPEEAGEYELAVGDVSTNEYVSVTRDTTVDGAVEDLRSYSPNDPEQTTVYYTYVVDGDGKLVGVASVREMLSAQSDGRGNALMEEVMEKDVRSFVEDADGRRLHS